jgi:hypothetical protein
VKTLNGKERRQMNNTQLYLSIGLPMLTIILTWLASRTELNRQIDRIDRSIETLRTELVAIRNDHHKDLVSLMGYMVPLHERMAKIEAQNR